MLEVDHVVPRAQAPERKSDPTNLWRICHNCHQKKTDNIWHVVILDAAVNGEEEVQMVEVATGKIVWRRVIPPKDFDAGRYLNSFNQLESGLMALEEGVKYLTSQQLISAFELAGKIGQWSWKIQAALLWEGKQRMNWGSVGDHLSGLGRSFGLSRSQIYNYLNAYEKFHETDNWLTPDEVPMTAYIYAAQTPDPEKALNHYIDQKALDPRYNTTDFKSDVLQAKQIGEGVIRGESPKPMCPTCKHDLKCKFCDTPFWPRVVAANLAADRGAELVATPS